MTMAKPKAEKRVEVECIETNGLLLGDLGRGLLTFLASSDNIDVFSNKFVKIVVLCQWKYFEKAIVAKVLAPFAVHFVLFLLYASLVLRNKADETGWGPWSITSIVFAFLLVFMFACMG